MQRSVQAARRVTLEEAANLETRKVARIPTGKVVCIHCRGITTTTGVGTAYCCEKSELDHLRTFRNEMEGALKSELECRSMLTEVLSLQHLAAKVREVKPVREHA